MIELLVVLAIMMVVAASALPKFVTFLSTYKLRSTLQQTGGMLQQMRMQAVRSNKNVQIEATTLNGLTGRYADYDGDGTWDSNEPAVFLPREVTLQTSGQPGGTGFRLQSVTLRRLKRSFHGSTRGDFLVLGRECVRTLTRAPNKLASSFISRVRTLSALPVGAL